MKASQLVEKLQEIIEREGDLEIRIFKEEELNRMYPMFGEVFEKCLPIVEEKKEYEDYFLACEYEESEQSYAQAPKKFITIK